MKEEKENTGKKKAADGSVIPCYKDVLVWLILIFTAVAMGAILTSHFYGDDVVLSYQSKNFVNDTGTNLRTYLGVVVQSWIQQGRFFPASNIYVSTLMHFIKTPFAYKMWIWVFILLDVYVFGAFIRSLTGSRRFSLLAMVVVPICFQVRTYHDPLVSYHMLMQVLILTTLLTGLGLLKYLRGHKRRWLFLSLIPYTFGLLTYEAAYTSIFVLFLLAFFFEAEKFRDAFCWRNIKRTFFAILPYFLVMAGIFLLTVYIKRKYGVHYDGITPSFSVWDIALTAAKQMAAAVPFSYHIFFPELRTSLGGFLRAVRLQDLAAAAFLAVSSYWLLRKNYKLKNIWCVLGVGLALLGTPALLIGVSEKYQRELYWGIGNLVVYLEYFGFTLLFVLLMGVLLKLFDKKPVIRRIAAACFSLGMASVLLVLMQDNRKVIHMKDGEYFPQKVIEAGVERGYFSEVEDGAIFVIDNYGFPPKGYYYYKVGKKTEVYSMEEFREQSYPDGTPVIVCDCYADPYQQILTVEESVCQGGELKAEHIAVLNLFTLETEE